MNPTLRQGRRVGFIKPEGKNYKKNILYRGTIKIYVPKGTDMRHRVFGWIQALMQDFSKKAGFIEEKWIPLKKQKKPINLRAQ